MAGEVAAEEEISSGSPSEDSNCPGVRVSLFDYSVENYFRAMRAIAKLCGEAESDVSQDSEIERFSSTIAFLREWSHFSYKPKVVRFAYEMHSPQGNDVFSSITLPQFSSAAIPKNEGQYGCTAPLESSKDFILYTGGPVWALDWCPRVHERSNSDIKCEFIAVAAHPPDSSYHKIGVPLIGRGIVQIWCVLNVPVNGNEVPPAHEKLKASKKTTLSDKSNEPKKPRGRPRKKPRNESADDVDPNNQLAVWQSMSDSPQSKFTEPKKPRGRPRKKPISEPLDGVKANYQLVVLEPVSESSNACENEAEVPPPTESPKQGPISKEVMKNKSIEPKETRGRLRKKTLNESVDDTCSNNRLAEQQPIYDSPAVCINEAEVPPPTESSKSGLTSKAKIVKNESIEPKKPRGRPKKKAINDFSDNVDGDNQFVQSTAVHFPADHCHFLSIEENHGNADDVISVNHVKKRKGLSQAESACNSTLTTSAQKKLSAARAGSCTDDVLLPILLQSEGKESPITNLQSDCASGEDPVECNNVYNSSLDVSLARISIPKDVAFPKLVLSLAHNGKVAWDVKWRPSSACDSDCKHRMGYLAVLLGNGSLEVWEVPLPRTIETVYSSLQRDGTDPRFVKLKPVFRCSKLKSGGIQSIPLSVEWSVFPPHDVLLVGCHDGTVALWKFSAGGVSEDTRPLLHFSADTAPIRSVAWAPAESDSESANIIATAGHGGLKFWDIRDPYRPLWDLHQVPKIIYSMDWHPDPRCVILSFDDGALRFLSLVKSAYDVPVTGESSSTTKQPGFHTYNYSSFAIWSVQVSRQTGMVAYCSEDGTVVCFPLTPKAVEKDPSRYRAPRFLCGSFTGDESALIINTPLPDTPLQLKKTLNESGDTLESIEGPSPNQAKRSNSKAKGQTPDPNNQTLALCYGDDPSIEVGYEETPASNRSKKTPKAKSKRRPEDDQALVCQDEGPANEPREEDSTPEAGKEFDVFPPKAVAMHRVRWNLNKGSERWLCYGGAAGIVRCQEIAITNVDKKSILKK